MSGQFLSPELKFIEKNFTGPKIDLTKLLNEDELSAIDEFEGENRRLTRDAAHYLCKPKTTNN